MMADAMDVHVLADYLENKCGRGPEIGVCYKTAMLKRIECVKDLGEEVDEELLNNGLTLLVNLFNVRCDDDSEERRDFLQGSKKLKACEENGNAEITICINELTNVQRILYGDSLTTLQFVDSTKCHALLS